MRTPRPLFLGAVQFFTTGIEMKKLVISIFLAFGMNFGCFAANNATDVYLLAKTENTSELNKVENIDVVDSDGNTALCSAIKFNDVDAYNILKKAGANTEHKCVKKIPSEQYKTFLHKVGAANKSWSFLGMGKWAWAAIGAGVAGGAVAAGMGGGGGGGGSDTSMASCDDYQYTDSSQCPAGYTLGSSCGTTEEIRYKCDRLISCPYENVECANGWVETGNTCQSGEILYKECEPLNCGLNATWSESGCICNSGYQNWVSGVGCSLIPLSCGTHAYQNGTSCQCEPGYENWVSGVGCSVIRVDTPNDVEIISNATIISEVIGKTDADGMSNNADIYIEVAAGGNSITGFKNYKDFDINDHEFTNAYNDTGTISIKRLGGTGDVYGIDSSWRGYAEQGLAYVYNANAVGSDAAGYIVIDNTAAAGSVYGLAGKPNQNCCQVGNVSVLGLTQDINVLGVINIKNNINIYNQYGSGAGTYGIYTENGGFNVGYHGSSQLANITGIIKINNQYNGGNNTGNVYGIYGSGNGLYGIYNLRGDYQSIHEASEIDQTKHAIIDIENIGDGNVYGLYSSDVIWNARGNGIADIKIANHNQWDSYGIYMDTHGNSDRLSGNSAAGSGTISMFNYGSGKSYAIYGTGRVYNAWVAEDTQLVDAIGTINVINYSNGDGFGLYGYNLYNNNNTYHNTYNEIEADVTEQSTINMQNLADGRVIAMYINNTATGSAENSGTININNIGTGTAIGIFGNTNSTITNSGTINITRDAYIDDTNVMQSPTGTAGNVIGIYAKSGSTVNNSGTINITTNGNAYGIYVESGSTVTNTGTITLNGISCDGITCDGSNSYSNHIVLNGGSLYNSGLMMAPQMNLNSMGGNVVAGLGSQFVVDNELSGDLNISSELVQNGNQTTYIAENMIDAGDVSGLNVRSASAMFNASLADNGHDVVMQMKDFNELTDNASLAAFLKNNYTNGNGTELFSTLKSIDNMSAFNNTLSGLTGLNTFTQFAHEDLSAMREISFSMNNKLFENSGRDSFDISDSTGYFSFSNDHNGGFGRYGISSDKISDNWKLGYGMAMANINTGDGDNMHRQNNVWLFYMPATYTNNDIELVIAPKAGFAHSEYNRRGYNNINYEGYIEKRIFGLMNDLRYPLTFGNWTFAPDLAFNAIVYDQSGHEDEQAFSLVIPDDRTVSVETGLGFYTKYEKQLSDGSRFKLNSGLMVYREFGDTYDIKLGMRGMDGTFSLYNNDYEYRGAASLGFDYTAGHLHLYGNAQYFMDNDNYMNFKGGISYRF